MNRTKKITILAAVLLAACLLTVFALSREEKKEEIQTSGEVVLSIPVDEVKSVSWNQPLTGEELSFTRGENWTYDKDAFFPVDGQKLEELLLSCFNDFSAAFVIENVEDYGQYGLDDPLCTINIASENETYEIKLGNFSNMDSQRYVSFGDGNVYLAVKDPLNAFDIELKNLIKNDEIPEFGDFSAIEINGEEKLKVIRNEEQSRSYRSGDKYYAEIDGKELSLDNHRVEEFAEKIQYLSLNNYASYNTSETELADYGMDAPELSVKFLYTVKDDESNETPAEFKVSISRDPDELKDRRESIDGYNTEMLIMEDPQDITAYARVNDSDIIYEITGEDYQRLMICRYNDLRDQHIIPVDFGDIVEIDINLDGELYSLIKPEDNEIFTYLGEEIDISDIESSMNSLLADSFIEDMPELKEEISLTIYLDRELQSKVQVSIYRYDGSNCLAVLNGEPLALTEREGVVELIENINSIILNTIPEAEK